jgi:flagellar M-ring protein FliF
MAPLLPAPALAEGAEGAAAGALPGPAGAAGTASLPGGAAGAAEAGEESMVTLSHVQGQLRASSIATLTQLIEAHPDEALALLRRWLAPEED